MEDDDLTSFEEKLLAELNGKEEKQEDKKGATSMEKLDRMKEWAAAQKAQKESGGSGEGKFFKAVEGKNTLRLIPGDYNGLPFVMYDQLYINGKFYCVRDGKNNPFSRTGWELHNLYKDSDPAEAKKMRQKWLPSQSVAINVLHEGKVKIWVTSINRIQELIEISEDFDIFNLEKEGHDVILSRKGTGLTTKYTVMPSPKATKAAVNENDVEDLDDFLKEQWASEVTMESVVKLNK